MVDLCVIFDVSIESVTFLVIVVIGIDNNVGVILSGVLVIIGIKVSMFCIGGVVGVIYWIWVEVVIFDG